MFGNSDWRDGIHRELERGLLLHNPVRIVWWGDYGIGKTQRLRYMEHLINTDFADPKPSFHPVVVMTRDLQDKSGFEQLHYELINRLKYEEMRKATVNYAKKLWAGTPGPIPFEQLTTSEDVLNAFRVLGSDNEGLPKRLGDFFVVRMSGQGWKLRMCIRSLSIAQLNSRTC